MAGPLGLLCTALSEFRAAMRPNFACVAHPHITFHATHLPHQHVRKHVDLLAYEVLASTARRTRSAYAELRSYDWNLFHLAAGKLSSEELGLVSAAQNLSMGSAARRLLHQGAGNGSCPSCGAQDSRIIHEAWVCTGLTKHQNAADVFLNALRPGVVSPHLLLGVPEQLSIAFDDQLFLSLGTSVNAADTPELVSKATLSREAQDTLVQLWGEDPDFTATTLADRIKCENQGCGNQDLRSC